MHNRQAAPEMGTRFRLNQYNWLGQKFLAHHRYSDILDLCQYSAQSRADPSSLDGENLFPSPAFQGDGQHPNRHQNGQPTFNTYHYLDEPLSDHLSYLSGLALMKMEGGRRLDDLIMSLQRLNFQRNGHYFLLLCQCLLYLGNHDSIVALCKQLFNKQIDAIALDTFKEEEEEEQQEQNDDTEAQSNHSPNKDTRPDWYLQWLSEESALFKGIFEAIQQNRLINEPKLWLTFAVSLEFQLQFRDADLAYRVASKLALGTACGGSNVSQAAGSNVGPQDQSTGASNYLAAHLKYAEFLVRRRADFKPAIQLLGRATSPTAPNYCLSPYLSLLMSSSPAGCWPNKSMELMLALDAHSISNRNPSFAYNQLALKCKLKLLAAGRDGDGDGGSMSLMSLHQAISRFGNETRSNLDYNLIKSHVVMNGLLAGRPSSGQSSFSIFRCPAGESTTTTTTTASGAGQSTAAIDKLIDDLRACDSSCWSSSSGLWNNLGLCYLARRRHLASLACLMRAHQLSPLDWRVHYNLGLAHLHVGLSHRALASLLAAQGYCQQALDCGGPSRRLAIRRSLSAKQVVVAKSEDDSSSSSTSGTSGTISGLLAVCLAELRLHDEARRLYAEMVAKSRRPVAPSNVPTWTLVNYLLLLFRTSVQCGGKQQHQQQLRRPETELDLKLIGRLLDYLEQMWLQRDQNDRQFSADLLEVAQSIGVQVMRAREEATTSDEGAPALNMRKTFAWSK